MEVTENRGHGHNTFLRLGAKLFVAFAFLLPIFFVPSQVITFQFSKAFFLVVFAVVLSLIFLITALKEGKISFPKSYTLLGLFAVLIAYVISGISSDQPSLSLLGQGFEVDTAFFVGLMAVISLLVPMSFRSKTALFNIYLALVGAFFLAALFNLIRFFAPSVFSFGIFTSTVSNLVGTWNDLGAFAGFVTLFALISLGVLEVRGLWKWALYAALVLGILFLAIVNFPTVWVIVAFFSLVFLLYFISYAKHKNGTPTVSHKMKGVSLSSLIVLIISIVFILAGNSLGNRISSALNIVQLEARPSWATTFQIAKETLKENPLFGAGPNQFVGEWLKYKPQAVNESLFWNIDFVSGIGTIPTSLITLGAVGIIAWVFFFVLFGIEGFKSIRKLRGDAFTHYLVFSSFISALYFWLIAIFYTPGHVVYTMAFLFTGIFVSTLVLEGVVEERHINFGDNPGRSFIGSLATIVLLLGVLTCGYLATERFMGYAMFNRAIIQYGADRNLDFVEEKVKRALAVEKSDVFFRTLTDIYLARLQELANRQPADSELEALRNQFQQYLTGAVSSAQAATNVNGESYQNWLSLARVYGSVVPFGVQGSYDQAVASYDKALSLYSASPSIYLAKAQLEMTSGNTLKAREYINEALKRKSNYTDAIFLLTQIEVAAGNTKKAIETVGSATLLSPTNPVLFFQLGLLNYNDKSFSKAVEAFERAVSLEPQYANARYFLGLSYDRLGKTDVAISQFEEIQKTNPDNEEVKLILENLRAGRSPFARVEPPLDDEPEKRKTPPVSESQQ